MIPFPWRIHMTLRRKMFFGFGTSILLVIAMVLSSIVTMKAMTGDLGTIREDVFPQTLGSLELESSILRMVIRIETSVQTGSKTFLDDVRKSRENLGRQIEDFKRSMAGRTETLQALESLENGLDNLFDLGSELYLASSRMERERVPEITERFNRQKDSLLRQVDLLKEDGVDKLEEAIGAINDQASFTSRLLLILGLAAVIVGLLVIVALSLSIIGPINNLVEVMKRAEHGDFGGRYINPRLAACWEEHHCDKPDCPAYGAANLRCWQIAGTQCDHELEKPETDKENLCESCKVYLRATRDEFSTIGEAFNNMVTGLVYLLTLIRTTASDVMTASQELYSISENLRIGSDQQAGSIEEVTSSIEEMNTTIATVAANAVEYFATAQDSNTSLLEMTASIEEVAHNADQLTGFVEETGSLLDALTSSIRQVAQHSVSLSEQVEQSSSALMQIDTSVKEVSEGAEDSSNLASLVMDRLMKEGDDAISRTADSIVQVKNIVTEAAEVMQNLAERSKDIGGVLQVIDEVSDQTRLLSLNAAILAAQSGTQGRAFSVVAEEIRALSDRTSSSTREITQLLSSIPSEIERVTKAIRLGTDRVDEGVKLIGEVREAIDEVSDAARKSADASSMIMTATGEQARGIRQAAELEQNIARMSKEIAQAMRYQAESCEKIMASSEQLKTLSFHVTKATEEQASGIKLIGHAGSESIKIARNITEATGEEARGSELIVKSIEAVSAATGKNMEVFAQLSEVVASLTGHSRTLQKEMERFKVNGTGDVEG